MVIEEIGGSTNPRVIFLTKDNPETKNPEFKDGDSDSGSDLELEDVESDNHTPPSDIDDGVIGNDAAVVADGDGDDEPIDKNLFVSRYIMKKEDLDKEFDRKNSSNVTNTTFMVIARVNEHYTSTETTVFVDVCIFRPHAKWRSEELISRTAFMKLKLSKYFKDNFGLNLHCDSDQDFKTGQKNVFVISIEDLKKSFIWVPSDYFFNIENFYERQALRAQKKKKQILRAQKKKKQSKTHQDASKNSLADSDSDDNKKKKKKKRRKKKRIYLPSSSDEEVIEKRKKKKTGTKRKRKSNSSSDNTNEENPTKGRKEQKKKRKRRKKMKESKTNPGIISPISTTKVGGLLPGPSSTTFQAVCQLVSNVTTPIELEVLNNLVFSQLKSMIN